MGVRELFAIIIHEYSEDRGDGVNNWRGNNTSGVPNLLMRFHNIYNENKRMKILERVMFLNLKAQGSCDHMFSS